MSHRQHRKTELQQKRKEREVTTTNGRRKQSYCSMAKEGVLGNQDLKKYEELRLEIKRAEKRLARRGITAPKFPAENPTRISFDLAKAFYYKYICIGCEEEEILAVEPKPSSLDAVARTFIMPAMKPLPQIYITEEYRQRVRELIRNASLFED